MDSEWFKQQSRKVGKTTSDLAEALGRDRTVISHIYTGRRRMTYDDAKVFASVLETPLADILFRAGMATEEETQQQQPGFSESDALPWIPKPDDRNLIVASQLGGGRNGVDVWKVKSNSMMLAGLMAGDLMLIDTLQRDRCKAGDIVIAQVYDYQVGNATTLLRRYDPPALVTASTDPADWRTHIVDDNNVVIMGRVIASWRAYTS